MTEQEINRAIQYVTAATSYGRNTVAEILRTGLSELAQLSTQSTCRFERALPTRITLSETAASSSTIRTVVLSLLIGGSLADGYPELRGSTQECAIHDHRFEAF